MCSGGRGGADLRLTALELTGQQVSEPPLQQWHDTTEEEKPHAPHGCPEAHTRPLAHWARVKPVVHHVLQICTQIIHVNNGGIYFMWIMLYDNL